MLYLERLLDLSRPLPLNLGHNLFGVYLKPPSQSSSGLKRSKHVAPSVALFVGYGISAAATGVAVGAGINEAIHQAVDGNTEEVTEVVTEIVTEPVTEPISWDYIDLE